MATIRKSYRKNAKPIADGPIQGFGTGQGKLLVCIHGVDVIFSAIEAREVVKRFQIYLERPENVEQNGGVS